jgi:hypothetical protein
MSYTATDHPKVVNSFTPETMGALRAMNLAYADVVVENHRLGLPVIQYRNGKTVETPTEELLPQALRYLATNGEPTPEQIGA